MKKFLVLVLALVSSLSFGIVASARPEHGHEPPPPPPPHRGPSHSSERVKAERVLSVTRDEIFRAERVAHHDQQASLRRAFSLQKQARNYYSQGRYQSTIRYSLRARDIATQIIEDARRPAPRREPRHEPRERHDDGGSSVNIRLNL